MRKNVGNTDKIIRIIVGVVLGVFYFFNIVTGILGIILLIAGIIFILTALVGRCALYYPFGISTCSNKTK